MDEVVKANYIRIKTDVEEIIRREIERIVKDPDLKYLLKKIVDCGFMLNFILYL